MPPQFFRCPEKDAELPMVHVDCSDSTAILPQLAGRNPLELRRSRLCLRLQPELDQAADGFGASEFPALTCDPFVDALHFVLSPLRVWAGSYRLLSYPFCDRGGRRDLCEGAFFHRN